MKLPRGQGFLLCDPCDLCGGTAPVRDRQDAGPTFGDLNHQGTARLSRNQTEKPSTQRRRGRREPQSFFLNHGWTRINTDKGETRISRIDANSVGDNSRNSGQAWCSPLSDPCESAYSGVAATRLYAVSTRRARARRGRSVVKNLFRKERCYELALRRRLAPGNLPHQRAFHPWLMMMARTICRRRSSATVPRCFFNSSRGMA